MQEFVIETGTCEVLSGLSDVEAKNRDGKFEFGSKLLETAQT